jgi:hypothetical protein
MDQDRVVKQLANIRAAPRCGAKTRAGTPCQCPAIRGRLRCRIHGGLSPGAPRGEENGNFKDGFWTCEAVQERQWAKEMVERYTKETGE